MIFISAIITHDLHVLPKMLTRMTLTLGSAFRISNAFSTCFAVAPPPTSRKLAGSPPLSCSVEGEYNGGWVRMRERRKVRAREKNSR